jgi:hypothetical protein
LGFANFYWKFIRNFAQVAAPLTRLTSDVTFQWGPEEQLAFERLKEVFISEPVLASFDPDKETVLECDLSGYAVGGVLSQYGDDSILRLCAYFSRKNNPHECNYEIHDKELLAVVRCLEEWDAKLRSVAKFKVITDYKNLEYFMKPRMLNERQMRWSLLLGRYDIEILYRLGKQNIRADALSRREQDLPAGAEDERLQKRLVQVLKPTTSYYEELAEEDSENVLVMYTSPSPTLAERDLPLVDDRLEQEVQSEATVTPNQLEELWAVAVENDGTY